MNRVLTCIERALYLAADTARRIGPDLAGVYRRLISKRVTTTSRPGARVATRLVNHIHRVLRTGMPCVLHDTDGNETDVQTAKAIVTEHFAVLTRGWGAAVSSAEQALRANFGDDHDEPELLGMGHPLCRP